MVQDSGVVNGCKLQKRPKPWNCDGWKKIKVIRDSKVKGGRKTNKPTKEGLVGEMARAIKPATKMLVQAELEGIENNSKICLLDTPIAQGQLKGTI